MPGGYAKYVDPLKTICKLVGGEGLTKADLNEWFQSQYRLTRRGADERARFLLRAGVLEFSSGRLSLSHSASRWYEIEDNSILVALLHSRTRFFGEMLAELSKQPLTTEQLRRASKKYGLDWNSLTQVNYRRGWLQSANLIKPVDGGHLSITDTGHRLLSHLQIHRPSIEPQPTQPRSAALAESLGDSHYVSPTRHELTESKRVFEVDPDLVDRGTTAHMDVQDQLAEAVRSVGLVPRSSAPHDPQFDVAWRKGEAAFVAEVKSMTEENEVGQLRLGLGQVLSYAYLLNWPGANNVQAILAVERPPTDEYWVGLCEQHGVILTWPDEFKDLFG